MKMLRWLTLIRDFNKPVVQGFLSAMANKNTYQAARLIASDDINLVVECLGALMGLLI